MKEKKEWGAQSLEPTTAEHFPEKCPIIRLFSTKQAKKFPLANQQQYMIPKMIHMKDLSNKSIQTIVINYYDQKRQVLDS